MMTADHILALAEAIERRKLRPRIARDMPQFFASYGKQDFQMKFQLFVHKHCVEQGLIEPCLLLLRDDEQLIIITIGFLRELLFPKSA